MNEEKEKAEYLFKELRANPVSSLSDVLTELNRGKIGVLSYLAFDRNEVPAGELSEKSNVTTARIARILNSLENKEYIIRREDELDKRNTLVVITENGKRLVNDAKEQVIAKIIKMIRIVGYEEINEYLKMVLRVKEILNEQ